MAVDPLHGGEIRKRAVPVIAIRLAFGRTQKRTTVSAPPVLLSGECNGQALVRGRAAALAYKKAAATGDGRSEISKMNDVILSLSIAIWMLVL
jgi:hypothetical protein